MDRVGFEFPQGGSAEIAAALTVIRETGIMAFGGQHPKTMILPPFACALS
jgi:hypothetical protein